MPAQSPFRLMLTLIRPRRLAIGIAVGLGVIATAASLAQPVLIGRLVGQIVGDGIEARWVALLAGVFLTEAVLLGVQGYLLGIAGSRVVLDLRRQLAARLMRAPMTEHAARKRGDTLSRLVSDTSLLRNSLTQALAVLVLSAVTVVGALGLMVFIDPVLTATLVACITATAVVSVAISRRIRLATQDMLERVGDLGSSLQRALAGVVTVKLSRAEEREADRIGGFAEQAHRAGVRSIRLAALMSPTANAGIQASFALVFTLGAIRMSNGQLGMGDLTAFLLLLFYLIPPLVALFSSLAQLQQGVAAAARVGDVLALPDESVRVPGRAVPGLPDQRPPGQRRPDDAERTGVRPVLSVRDVTFGYEPERPVLHRLSLDVPRRGVTALVGPSGSGKSTVFALLTRLWEADEGTIRLDGVETRDLPLSSVRERIAMVEQEAAVLDASIRENVLYARPDATDAELADAVERADLATWVASLPQGLDTTVGEQGAAVSGGQRQRIAIARMLLLQPDVLLLDEATAHLDGHSESALRRVVREIARDRAVVVIAHRLSTVVDADVIHLLEDGRLRASGTHAQLLDDELYTRLVRHQLGGSQPALDLREDVSTPVEVAR
jgi:ABC-type multidrug transport system fused ATPase/permease subunit